MSFDAIANIVLLVTVLGIIIIILRRLPDAISYSRAKKEEDPDALQKKGIQVEAASGFRKFFGFWYKRFWNFLLEAKDLKPRNVVGYRVKKLLRRTRTGESVPIIPPPKNEPEIVSTKDESYYLEKIKQEPKNLENYSGLGAYYLDNKSFSEAKDVFGYLASYQPGDAGVLARLAFCQFHLKEYKQAVENYEKSLRLDSTQPNRYYNLALCYEQLGNIQKAMISLEKAVEIEPAQQKYRDTLNKSKLKVKVEK